MKVLFVHDHIFVKDQKNIIYSAAAFPSEAWDRYLEHFLVIDVLGRYQEVEGNIVSNYVKSTHKNVNFHFLKNRSSVKKLMQNIFIEDKEIKNFVLNSDAVIVRLPSENGLRALNLAIKYNKPYAIEVVGCVWDALWNYGTLNAKIYAPYMYYRMKKSIRKSDLVLYVTENFLQHRYPASAKSFTTNASNININPVNIAVLKKKNKQTKDMFTRKIIFGIIGNYKTKYKGIDVAIKALSEINIDFELRILGKGDSTTYAKLATEMGIGTKIVFSGSLPNGQPVYDWIDEIDCYLQPSLAEGLPRSLIEAMSRGCFCFASSTGGIPELLEKDFLHTPGNASELKSSIEKYIQVDKLPFISEQMDINFNHATKYYKDIIEKKRYTFYEKLKTLAIEQKDKNEST